jgi:predicted TIM-barrel fold metal-dependent hydrolase
MMVAAQVKTRVVDADGHVLEPPAALVDYIDPAYRDRAPHIVERGGKEYWEGDHWMRYMPSQMESPTPAPVTNTVGLAGIQRWKDLRAMQDPDGQPYTKANPAGFFPEPRLKVMDEEGFDAAVLYPTLALTFIPDPGYALALGRAYNDWLADYCKAAPERLFGAAVLPLQDIDASVRELRRCVSDLGFKAAFLRPNLYIENTHWWDPVYEPFWSACEELDVAIGFHPHNADAMAGAARHYGLSGGDAVSLFVRAPVVNPLDSIFTLGSLIAGGVLEQHPGLRLAFLEASGGWLVAILERLDHRFEHLGQTLPVRLGAAPSEYFKRQLWISFDPDEAAIELTARTVGADRLIFGSDFPHPDAFYPNFVPLLRGRMAGLSGDEQRLILGENARRLYKLPR